MRESPSCALWLFYTQTKGLLNLQCLSEEWMNAHIDMYRRGAGLEYACAIDRGEAEITTFDLKRGDH